MRASALALAGDQFMRPFPTAGRYAYHCTIHPEMRGVVQVGPDTVAPRPSRLKAKRLKAKRGRARARISFRLPEAARVSATLASKRRPRKALRRTRARNLQDGARSLTLRIAGLAPGAYRVTVEATDREGNLGSGSVALTIPCAAPTLQGCPSSPRSRSPRAG